MQWHLGRLLTYAAAPTSDSGKPLTRVVWPYFVASLGSLLALGAGLASGSVDPDDSVPALLFLGVVGLSAWLGGLGPALLATAFGGLAIDYFFEQPRYVLAVTNSRTLVDIAAFLLMAVLVGLLHHQQRRSTARLAAERDRAETAVRAREDLLATVSHSLRTPLTTIQMSLFSLRDDGQQLAIDDRKALLTEIASEANRLVHFVNDALALNRLENVPPVRRERNDAGEIVWAVVDRCRPQLEARPITLDIPDDLPLLLFDAGLLDQALTALLENVVTHTPPGTPVWIEGTLHNDVLCISVSDAGPGISDADKERIFGKYERIDGRGPGVGLGLTLARAAAGAQGGQLCTEDSQYGGARFVLRLPGVLRSESVA
jgi:two-component system sensor histidine kinase KdpD